MGLRSLGSACLVAGILAGVALPATSAPPPGQVRVKYSTPKSQQYVALADTLQRQRVLETFASAITSTVQFPGALTLVAEECGRVNAYYDPQSRSIHLCYELVQEIHVGVGQEAKAGKSGQEAARTGAGAILFVLFHELGHAVIHILNVPYFGRQEDVADQFATYLSLHAPDATWSETLILGGHWFFRNKGSAYVKAHLANEHSLAEVRQFNIVCWAYGSNPQRYVRVAQAAQLPADRAKRCPSEYQDLDRAVRKNIGPHLRGAAARRI